VSGPIARERHAGDEFYYLRGQATRAILGLVVMFLLSRLDPAFLARHARKILVVALVLLVAVLIPGIGIERRHARRWLVTGFQPSEFMKLALVIYYADFMTRREERLQGFKKGLGPPLAVLCAASFLILLEPNLSPIALLGIIGVSLLFAGGARLAQLAPLCAAVLIAGGVSLLTRPYQLERLLEFYDGRLEPAGAEFQIYQATLGLGCGGIVGPGLGHSLQKYFFLPDAHTDFIMAIVGEELGFVGSIAVLALFALLLQRGLSIAWRSSNRFHRLLAIGLTTCLFCQTFVNLCVVTALIPTTGQPLPFLSYGGSNLMMTLAEIGLLLGLSRFAHERAPATAGGEREHERGRERRRPAGALGPFGGEVALSREEFLTP
jgi:cell division protein FtsW